MSNDKPCDTCEHFDPVLRGALKAGLKPTVWGWCAVRSVYPAQEGPGQTFPANVMRVEDPSSPAKPHLVKRGEVATQCNTYVSKRTAISKADLLKKLNAQNTPGKR